MMIIPGLYGGQVDLVNWLEDQDTSEVQGFHEGAKETYWPSVQSAVGVKQRYWATPEESLQGASVSLLDDMDECLAVNFSDDACLDKLTGDDAAWARSVAEEYKKSQQQRQMMDDLAEQKMLDDYLLLGDCNDRDWQKKSQIEDDFQQKKQHQLLDDYPSQMQIDDFSQDEFMSSEPNVSPFASSCGGSPFSSGSGITGSPNSDFYSSLEYQNTLSPEYQHEISINTSSPEYQKIDQQPEFILADVLPEYNVSSIVAYENELNSSFKDEATLQIDNQDSDVIGDEFVLSEVYEEEMKFVDEPTPVSSPVRRVKIVGAVSERDQASAYNGSSGQQNDPSIIYCKRVNLGEQGKIKEEIPLLKDIISNKGDDIMRELLSSPESTCGNYDSGDSVDGSMASPVSGMCDDSESDDSFSVGSSGKRVPFTATERRLRKKEQNKRAAIRYREKKKTEMEEVSDVHHEALQLNKKLQAEKSKKLAEFGVLRSLLMAKFGIEQ